jgi:probable HAF family extracellular repeat protein
MRTRFLKGLSVLGALALGILPGHPASAQTSGTDKPLQVSAQDRSARHHRYKLMQVETFGGPDSDNIATAAGAIANVLNSQGATVGLAATSTADPFSPHCFYDCFVDHALKFKNGELTDLGALPGTNSSGSYAINDNGLIVGVSENGLIDPLTGLPAYHAVVWSHGGLEDLGTFGGSLSQAINVNNQGQVVGVAANSVPDQYAGGLGPCITWFGCNTVATQQRAFLWEGRKLRDLGTLGGNDAVAYLVNQQGQVVGVSYTNTTPNPTTGLPTQDPFLWERGKMVDLGSFGGTFGAAYRLNNRGQVVGFSNLAGDKFNHAFLWDRGALTDLGTLGGDSAYASWLNDAGDVVGGAETAGDQVYHAFLWRHGAMTDLGTLAGDTDSGGYAINAGEQVVGYSSSSSQSSAILWENGGPMVDLNALVEPPSDLHLDFGQDINDSGEILAYATLPNGDIRIAVLVPDGYCGSDCEGRIAASESARVVAAEAGQVNRTTISQSPISSRWRATPFGPRHFTPRRRAVPTN